MKPSPGIGTVFLIVALLSGLAFAGGRIAEGKPLPVIGSISSLLAGELPAEQAIPNTDPEGGPQAVTEGSLSEMTINASQDLVSRAPYVVVADQNLPAVVELAAQTGDELSMPVLFTDGGVANPALEAELDRLKARTILTVGEVPTLTGYETIIVPVSSPMPKEARDLKPESVEPADLLVLVTPDWDVPATLATAKAVGARIVNNVAKGDPRMSEDMIQLIKDAGDTRTVAFGKDFGSDKVLAQRLRSVRNAPPLPGGGQVIFPGRRFVALYGNPATPRLGLLGEQDLDGTVKRAKEMAKPFEKLDDHKIIPSFEIIATVASSAAGADGDYSDEVDPESLRPWIERAQKEDIYVVLDLQPGRSSFLKQAKMYEELLKYPNVGMALDPEWRLKPNQLHMRQIGSVDAEEINQVHDYLASIVLENELPQKLLVVHQFRTEMVRNRDNLKTSDSEIAMLIHVDGYGPPGAKNWTWGNIRRDAPRVWWGWKNFIDEDEPMLTPAETYNVEPRPDLVTYQ